MLVLHCIKVRGRVNNTHAAHAIDMLRQYIIATYPECSDSIMHLRYVELDDDDQF